MHRKRARSLPAVHRDLPTLAFFGPVEASPAAIAWTSNAWALCALCVALAAAAAAFWPGDFPLAYALPLALCAWIDFPLAQAEHYGARSRRPGRLDTPRVR